MSFALAHERITHFMKSAYSITEEASKKAMRGEDANLIIKSVSVGDMSISDAAQGLLFPEV